jgi:hypothetical protein
MFHAFMLSVLTFCRAESIVYETTVRQRQAVECGKAAHVHQQTVTHTDSGTN